MPRHLFYRSVGADNSALTPPFLWQLLIRHGLNRLINQRDLNQTFFQRNVPKVQRQAGSQGQTQGIVPNREAGGETPVQFSDRVNCSEVSRTTLAEAPVAGSLCNSATRYLAPRKARMAPG